MLSRAEIIQSFLNLYEHPSYLEIGVHKGETFNNVIASTKIAVDPAFLCDHSSRADAGQEIRFFELGSDDYFADATMSAQRFDVIFIDGLHTFEQTLRDLLNSILFLRDDGIIIIDDVIPSSYYASLPDLALFRRIWPKLGASDMSWMGDVFKLVFFVQSQFQQFSYATVQDSQGQFVIWRSRRPASALPPRKIEYIGRLEYSDVLDNPDVFNVRPLTEIVEAAKSSLSLDSDTFSAFDASKIAGDNSNITQAKAIYKCARTAEWPQSLCIQTGHNADVGGCQRIADATTYELRPFICSNRDELARRARDILSAAEKQRCVKVAPINLYFLENVVILPNGALMVDGQIVAETLLPIPSNQFMNDVYTYLSNSSSVDFGSVVDLNIDRPVLVLEQPGLFNYGHWLLEMYPKIFPVLSQINSGEIGIGLPAQFGASTIIGQTLSHAGVPAAEIHWIDIHAGYPRRPARLKRVLYVSPISRHSVKGYYMSPWSADVLSRLTFGIPAGSEKKLFISRQDAKIRCLLNEDEVYSVLEPMGYVRVRTSELSFREQVSTFKGAREIIGVLGASLANIAFCRSGAKLLNIAPNNTIDRFYWDLASLRNVAYWHLPGVPVTGEEAQLNCNFNVDVRKLAQFVERFETS